MSGLLKFRPGSLELGQVVWQAQMQQGGSGYVGKLTIVLANEGELLTQVSCGTSLGSIMRWRRVGR